LKTNHPEGWTLFLLGLAAFQGLDQNDPLSYYRISGQFDSMVECLIDYAIVVEDD
jgi:hypothetical protein